MSNGICLVLGSGATFDSGHSVPEHPDFKLLTENCQPPMDYNFFKMVLPSSNVFSALNFILQKLKLSSMEYTWSCFDCAAKLRLGSKKDLGYLQSVDFSGSLKKWGFDNLSQFENFWETANQEYLKLGCQSIEIDSKHRLTGDLGRDFRRLIYGIYAKLEAINNNGNNIKKLLELLNNKEFAILSFNYDLLVEKNIKDFRYIKNDSVSDGIKFVKLHGSLNWVEEPNRKIVQDEKNLKAVVPIYRKLGDYIQPAIVPPTLTKNELKDGYDTPIGKIIDKQWEEAKNIINQSKRFVFIGYRFPDTDTRAIKLFHEVFSKKNILFCVKEHRKTESDILQDLSRKLNAPIDTKKVIINNYGFSGAIKENVIKNFIEDKNGQTKT